MKDEDEQWMVAVNETVMNIDERILRCSLSSTRQKNKIPMSYNHACENKSMFLWSLFFFASVWGVNRDPLSFPWKERIKGDRCLSTWLYRTSDWFGIGTIPTVRPHSPLVIAALVEKPSEIIYLITIMHLFIADSKVQHTSYSLLSFYLVSNGEWEWSNDSLLLILICVKKKVIYFIPQSLSNRFNFCVKLFS